MQLLSPAHRLLNLCRLVTRPALESWKASHFWWKVSHSPDLIFCTIDFVQVLPLSLQFLLGCTLAFTSCKIASQRVWCEWPWEMFVCMLSLQDAIYVQQMRQMFKVSILCVETPSMLQTRQRTKTSNLCLCSDSWEQFQSAKQIPLMWEAYYTHQRINQPIV